MTTLDKVKHFIRTATLLLLVTIPLIFSFSFYNSYDTPKYFVFYTFLCLCSPCAVYIAIVQKETRRIFFNPAGICIGCYIIFLLIATVASRCFNISFTAFIEISGYVLAYCIWIVSLEKKDTVLYIKAICITGFFVSLYALLQHSGIDLPFVPELNNEGLVKTRSISTMGNPTFLAGYLAIVAPLYFYLFFKEHLSVKKDISSKGLSDVFKHFSYPLMWLICTIALILTYTRGAWAAFFISHLVMCIFVIKQLSKDYKKYIIGFIIMLTLAVGIVMVYDRLKGPNYGSITLSRKLATLTDINYIYSQRLFAWKAAFEIFKDHPFAGTGPGTFRYVYYQYRYVEPAERHGLTEYYDTCHNHFLDLASTCGIGSLLAFCALIVTVLYYTLKLIMKETETERLKWICILSSLIAYIIHVVFLFPKISYEVFWWFLLSLISIEYYHNYSATQLQQEHPKKDVRRGSRKNLILGLNTRQMVLLSFVFLVSLILFVVNVKNTIADYYLNKGEMRGNTGDIRTTAAFYDAAIANKPDDPLLYHYKARYLGNIYRSAGMKPEIANEVINLYNKAAQLNPLDPCIQANMGSFYQSLSEHGDKSYISRAEEAYKKAISMDPYQFLNYNYIATLYAMKGENEKALQNFNKSLSLYEKSELVHYNMAVFFLLQKDTLSSKTHAVRALQIKPDFQKARELLQIIESGK